MKRKVYKFSFMARARGSNATYRMTRITAVGNTREEARKIAEVHLAARYEPLMKEQTQ